MAAESMALKHQLLVVHRTRKRAPPMTPWVRLVFGLCSLWIAPDRRKKVSVVFRPSTFQRFHDALVTCRRNPCTHRHPFTCRQAIVVRVHAGRSRG